MPILTLRHVVVGAAKADFVKHSVRVSLDLPLNDDTLKLCSQLAYLAMEKESITVTLESAQLPLFGGDAELQNIAERVADETEHPERKIESVTLDATSRARMNRALEVELKDYGVSGADGPFLDVELNQHAAKLDAELKRVKAKRAHKAKTKKRA